MNKRKKFNSIYELFPEENKLKILIVYSMLPSYSKYVIKKGCGIDLKSKDKCKIELTEKEVNHLHYYIIPFVKENIINISKVGYIRDKSINNEINEVKQLHNLYTDLLIEKFGVENYVKANSIILSNVRKKEGLENKQQLIDFILENEKLIVKKLSLMEISQKNEPNNLSSEEIKFQKICNSKLFGLFDKIAIIKTIKITMILNNLPYTNKLSVLLPFLENNLASVLNNLRKQLYIKYEYISSEIVDDTNLLEIQIMETIPILLDDPQIKFKDLSYLISIYLEVSQYDVERFLDTNKINVQNISVRKRIKE